MRGRECQKPGLGNPQAVSSCAEALKKRASPHRGVDAITPRLRINLQSQRVLCWSWPILAPVLDQLILLGVSHVRDLCPVGSQNPNRTFYAAAGPLALVVHNFVCSLYFCSLLT